MSFRLSVRPSECNFLCTIVNLSVCMFAFRLCVVLCPSVCLFVCPYDLMYVCKSDVCIYVRDIPYF